MIDVEIEDETWARDLPDAPAGQVTQTAGLDDKQAPRISYLPNEALMPRKKFSTAHDLDNTSTETGRYLRLVQVEEIDSAESTILLAEFSQSPNGIYGTSTAGGAAYKSHRPTNAIKSSQANGVFDGETYSKDRPIEVWKLTYDEAKDAIERMLADHNHVLGNTVHHISYINPTPHLNGGGRPIKRRIELHCHGQVIAARRCKGRSSARDHDHRNRPCGRAQNGAAARKERVAILH